MLSAAGRPVAPAASSRDPPSACDRITGPRAVDHHDGLPRRPRRVTVAGGVAVGVDGDESCSIEGDASHRTPAPAPVQAPHRPRTGPVQARGDVTGISLSECRVSGY
ncbi:hypothetical protein Shyhy01_53350 [Streptomyces hygroscopicus subsp. hygroscopicus]|nr:hypothetical protein Shyhy01_53350 [Streptomyces hygroscopicus subsp. hygroscopicus]